MGRAPQRRVHAQVDAGFPEQHRQQLGVTVGEVQKMHITKAGQAVVILAPVAGQQPAGIQGETSGASGREHLQKFTTIHAVNPWDQGGRGKRPRPALGRASGLAIC